ncbi:hypothetical protein QE94_003945 [Salmonella enterica subsp. enterica]|nr:hypothetical protein [Salmonella enterica subsp. enterica]
MHTKYLIDLLDDVCSYHAAHDNYITFRKITNIMDKLLSLLEPFNIDEAEARNEGRNAREEGNEKKVIEIHNRLSKKWSALYELQDEKNFRRLGVLLVFLSPYDYGKDEDERPNIMDNFVMRMNEVGVSDDEVYTHLLKETDFLLKDLISEIIRHSYLLARFDIVIDIISELLNLLKPFDADEIKIIDRARKARSDNNEKEITKIYNTLVQKTNSLLQPKNHHQLIRLKLLLIFVTPYGIYKNECKTLMHSFLNYMMKAGVPYELVYINLRKESVKYQIW